MNIGNLQQGQVVALYNYMAQIIVELIKLASLIITLNKSMACADRVAGILDVKSSMEYKAVAGNDKTDDNMAVEFNHVTFTYEGAGASAYRTSPSGRRKDRRLESSEEPEVVRVRWSA